MVAKIKSGKSLIGALNYNERKVRQEKALLIDAVGYSKDVHLLNFHDKLLRLTNLAERNERTKTNTVHISLNFASGEVYPDEKLRAIAATYIEGIGFERQPYLVYKHLDAGHPHIHIVTTNIKSSSERISLHYIGQNYSERVRKKIETEFNLVRAEEQPVMKPSLEYELPIAQYGKEESKRMVTNILSHVLRTYKFTSIPELNAALQKYRVTADRGAKDSRMFSENGLVYLILDEKGHKIGVPIKASSIYGKPTLSTLEKKFLLNELLRKPFKAAIIERLHEVLSSPQTESSFLLALEKRNIRGVLRKNEGGRLYGITFVDEQSKVVFNGSDLGKAYSANQLSEYFLAEAKTNLPAIKKGPGHQMTDFVNTVTNNTELIDLLFKQEHEEFGAINQFKRKKRKGLKL